jgi:hypothetical protein
MKGEAEVDNHFQKLAIQGVYLLRGSIQRQQLAKMAGWFEKQAYRASTGNLPVVEVAGRENDPCRYARPGLVKYELTHEGPFQTALKDDYPAEKAANCLAQLRLCLKKEAATY